MMNRKQQRRLRNGLKPWKSQRDGSPRDKDLPPRDRRRVEPDDGPGEQHEFEPFHPDWFMPRCKVCREFGDHPVHQTDTEACERCGKPTGIGAQPCLTCWPAIATVDAEWKRLALHALSDLDYLGVPIGDITGVDDEVLRAVEEYQRGQTAYT